MSVAADFSGAGAGLGAFGDRAYVNGDDTSGARNSPPLDDAGGGSRVRAVVAVPASPSCFPGSTRSSAGGQQLVLVAGERRLMVVDAARGELVQDVPGAGGEGHRGSRHDGGGDGSSGGRGVSHIAVTPDGKAFFSVGEVSVLPA